jgi:hypothetical protein
MPPTSNPGSGLPPIGQRPPGKFASLGRPFLAFFPTLAIIVLAATSLRSGDQLKDSGSTGPNEAQERLAKDVKLLQAAGVATDGPGLVAFFERQTSSEQMRGTIKQLIGQLGDDDFQVREKATRELITLGPAAVPALQLALRHADTEVRARAKRCLGAFKDVPPGDLLAAAVRVMTARRPHRGIEILIAYLPDVAAPELEEEVAHALTVLGMRNNQADPALVRALEDPLPVRRAIAGEVLAGARDGRYLPKVRKLLSDPDRAVSLHVGTALVQAQDKETVPALIDLVADSPTEQASQAEDLLRQLAGPKAPQIKLAGGATGRAEHRAAWKAWWKEQGATVNFSQLDAGPPRKAKVSARASATWNGNTPDKPFNGNQSTWNSGGPPPQWIEGDLGAPARLANLRLTVNQSPDGHTTHEVWVSNEPIGEERASAKLVHTFNGHTKQLQQLKFDFPKGLASRYVQIRTTQSPSWVAWVAIEVYVGRTRPSFVTASAK